MDISNPTLNHTLFALADPNRRAILQCLSGKEIRVTDLAKYFAISLNGVSKHILVLEKAGLVSRRKSGREHFLSLRTKPLDEAAAWIEARRSEWNDRLDRLNALLQEES